MVCSNGRDYDLPDIPERRPSGVCKAMPHQLDLVISPDFDGKTVKQFLREELHFSMHQISRIKYRPEGFRINGKTVWVNAVLRAGDVLSFALDDAPDGQAGVSEQTADKTGRSAASAAGLMIPVLYEDGFLLIADKPAGMVSHPSAGHHGDSALDVLSAAYGRLYLIGRLDKDTSGVLLFARQQETASLLAKQKESGLLQKIYLAEAAGVPDPLAGTVAAPLRIAREMPLKMESVSCADPDAGPFAGLAAATHYETISVRPDGNRSLLRVTIEHGRTHQIRVHLASAGHPLIGDALYGPASCGAVPGALSPADTSSHLHALSLCLRHPYSGKTLQISAPVPGWAAAYAADLTSGPLPPLISG